MSKNTKLTSLKVEEQLFEDFKIEAFKYKFTFTKLVNNSLKLFMENEDFKKQIINYK